MFIPIVSIWAIAFLFDEIFMFVIPVYKACKPVIPSVISLYLMYSVDDDSQLIAGIAFRPHSKPDATHPLDMYHAPLHHYIFARLAYGFQ